MNVTFVYNSYWPILNLNHIYAVELIVVLVLLMYCLWISVFYIYIAILLYLASSGCISEAYFTPKSPIFELFYS